MWPGRLHQLLQQHRGEWALASGWHLSTGLHASGADLQSASPRQGRHWKAHRLWNKHKTHLWHGARNNLTKNGGQLAGEWGSLLQSGSDFEEGVPAKFHVITFISFLAVEPRPRVCYTSLLVEV